METFLQYAVICPLVMLAGFVDAIAGGGGLISLPGYLLSGLPVHNAIATNKMSSTMGTVLATFKFAKSGFIPWKLSLSCVVCAFAGSSLGANLALLMDAKIFMIFMLIVRGRRIPPDYRAAAPLQASIAKVARKFSNRFSYLHPHAHPDLYSDRPPIRGVEPGLSPSSPITVMLSFALGLDSLVGVSIILLGGAVGFFDRARCRPSTTLLAQEIAGLVPFSGIWYRAICLVVFWVVTNLFLIRYAMKIKKNPQLSPMYDLDLQSEMKASTTDLSSFGELTGRRIAILAALVTLLSVAVHSVPLCVAGLCITGISYGACPTISSAFTSSFYGAKYFSLNFSVMNFNLTGASFVATAASVLLTQTGGYAAPLVLLLVLAVAALALNLSIKRP